MAKLDIIIPHYHESVEMMRPMFDMLKLQRNVKWTDFKVLIVNDGEDCALPEDFGKDMPFRVRQLTVPHGGVSAARNAGMDHTRGDWVMFCDADDAFVSTVALQTYFRFMEPGKDFVASAFFEEARSLDDGHMMLLWHNGKDYIFIHGKVFRRKWLYENNIRFNDELTLHEDSYFVAVAKNLLKDKRATYIKDPLYLWQYNPTSATRKQDNFVLCTYDHLVKKNSALTDEFLRRGMFVPAKGIVCRTITDAYCRLNSKKWNTPENRHMIRDAEDCVALFLKHYDYIFKNAGEKVVQVGLDDLLKGMIKRKEFDPAAVIPFERWVDRLRK